jgi:hypothetical protein
MGQDFYPPFREKYSNCLQISSQNPNFQLFWTVNGSKLELAMFGTHNWLSIGFTESNSSVGECVMSNDNKGADVWLVCDFFLLK